jgi:LmbE family N-acetylglucosaminyl deacetylase
MLCLLTDNNDNPIITRPHIVFTDGRQRQPNHNTTTYCVYGRATTTTPSVNIICGRIMIGLSFLSSVSKHNMWWYYDWVVVVFRQLTQYLVVLWPNDNTTTYCVYWRTTTTINPIIIRPHCMFTDWRQQRQPNHNTTTYWVVVVFRQLTQYLVVLWLGCRCYRPSVNTICGRIIIGLSLSSVSKHNMWSSYDCVVIVFRQ